MFYRLYQNTNEKSKANGKWYAKAVTTAMIDTNALAEIMQRNCTVKRSDIKAVIEELTETMADQLKAGRRVKLNGLGSFKLGLSSKGAPTAAAYDVRKHLRDVHVVFRPDTMVDSTGQRGKVLISGVQVQELPKNMVDTSGDDDGGGDGE